MDFHEAANIFPLDEEHLHELADDIREHGQQMPIEVFDGQILDGRRRWKACKMANVIPKTVEVDPDDPVAYVLSLNLQRRHLTTSQATDCAARATALWDKLKEEAKERKREGGRHKDVENLPQADKGKTRDKIGRMFGVSGRNVAKAQKIHEEGIPELSEALREGKVSVNNAMFIAQHERPLQGELLQTQLSRPRCKIPTAKPGEPEPEPDLPTNGKVRGVGIQRAHEAIACLKQIPKNDALRKRGFQVVTDWIKHNQ